MAILDAVPGIKVTVRVGNADCVEYDDPDPENPQGSSFTCPTSIKYIEAITDAEFGIRYAVDSSYAWGYQDHKLKLSIRIDGKHFKSPVVSPEYPKGCRLSMDERTDHGTWVRRKPKFSPMSTGEWMLCVCFVNILFRFLRLMIMDPGTQSTTLPRNALRKTGS